MSQTQENRGASPVGFITELDGIEAACVIYLRLWFDGPDSQASVWTDFAASLGADQGRKTLKAFEELCSLCVKFGRRPLMRHAVNCTCLGSDEACFANFIGTAVTGDREDALLIATLLVRPDVAPLLTSLATDFGLSLKRMNLCAPRHLQETAQAFQQKPTMMH